MTMLSSLVLFALLGSKPKDPVATLRVGEGLRFSDGRVMTDPKAADVVFGYGTASRLAIGGDPASSNTVTTVEPVLAGARAKGFATIPNPRELKHDPIDGWGPRTSRFKAGQYVLVRGLAGGRDYVLGIVKIVKPKEGPPSWRITFSYRPLAR